MSSARLFEPFKRLIEAYHRWKRKTFPASIDEIAWRHNLTVQLFTNLQRELAALEQRVTELDAKATILNTPVILDNLLSSVTHLPNTDTLPIFNTTVVERNESFIFCSRRSNLIIQNDGSSFYYKNGKTHNTINVLHHADKNFRFSGERILDDSLIRNCEYARNGIEDIRMFVWKGDVFGIGAGVSLSPEKVSITQILFRVENDVVTEFFILQSPVNSAIEKNWTPLVVEDDLFLVYSISPLIIYRFKDGVIELFKGDEPINNQLAIRGGTPFMPFRNKFISIAHLNRIEFERKRYYRHLFVVLDYNLDVDEVSEPFFLQRKGIEFACGLTPFGEDLLISYGLSDRSANFCILPHTELNRYLVV